MAHGPLRRPAEVFALALFLLVGALLEASDKRLDRLTEPYRKWVEEEVVYIASPREREAFLDLQGVEEWDGFIEAFWRRRDPDPLTPVNEFKEEHYRRIAHANRELGRDSPVPGWMTDRGKMYIILGAPRDRETFRSVPFLYAAEVWFYEADREKGLPPLYLLFFQEGFAGTYRLFNHLIDGPERLMPAQPLDPENPRLSAYQQLQDVSPELAHAAITMRADRGAYAGVVEEGQAALDAQMVLAEIYRSPYRRVDSSYVDAARHARGLVESRYLFNYVPSFGIAHVLPGPGGLRFVHYTIEIEPNHMTLVKDERRYYTRLELAGEVTTADGRKTVLRLSKRPFIELGESELRQISARPFAYRDVFPLVSGEFRLRVVLKNEARSQYTIFETELSVPPEAESKPILGEPVLLYRASRTTEPGTERLYRAYEFDGTVLEPNARRVYAAGDSLRAHIPVEEGSAGQRIRLRIKSQDRPEEELATRVARLSGFERGVVLMELPLPRVGGGRFQLDVELLDKNGVSLEARSTPFDVTARNVVARPWVLKEGLPGEKTADMRVALAEQKLILGDADGARELCRTAVRENPDLLPPRVLLARFHLDEQDPAAAIELLEPLREKNASSAELLATLGDAYFQAQQYRDAVTVFEPVLNLRRPEPPLLNALALSHLRLGNPSKAVAYLKRSIEMDPKQGATRALLQKLESAASQR